MSSSIIAPIEQDLIHAPPGEGDHRVDVAVGVGVASGDRSEHREVGGAPSGDDSRDLVRSGAERIE